MLGKGTGVPETPRGMLWRPLGFPLMNWNKGGNRKDPLFSSGILIVSVVTTLASHTAHATHTVSGILLPLPPEWWN